MSYLPRLDSAETGAIAVGNGVLPKIDSAETGAIAIGSGVLPRLNSNEGNLNFTFIPSGGVAVGGAATISERHVLHFVHTPSGGAKVGFTGSTPKLFYQNGVWSSDVLPWVPTGGVSVGGAAAVQWHPTMHYYHAPAGGVTVGGEAPSSFTWTLASYTLPRGGIKVGGTATVSAYSPAILANLAATTPKLTGAYTGDTFVASMGMTLPALTGRFTVLAGQFVTLAATLPRLTANFSGGAFIFAPVLPTITGSFAGSPALVAALTAKLPRLSGSFTGVVTASGTFAATLPSLRAELQGLVGALGALRATLPAPAGALVGRVGVSGSLLATLPVITGSFGAGQGVSGSMAIRLPSITGLFNLQTVVAQIMTLVVNTITNSTVRYANYPYNSFAEIDGKYYAAGPTGLYQIDIGTADGVTKIDAFVTSGKTDFGSEFQKRVENIYAAMRSEGDITLSVGVDENDPVDYTLSPLDIATLKQRRSIIGKGLRGKYWQFTISNTDGCDFDLDTMHVAAVPMSRRI